ncbi:MAG: asparaginase [Bdellovibrionales bacterium]|nr:asparaginase [Bdellovibrionales bacterium]
MALNVIPHHEMAETNELREIIDIAILEMGGTINGILSPEDPSPEESRVIKFLTDRQSDYSIKCTSEIVVMKDSRAVLDSDREILAAAIVRTPVSRILIPHGTFTMPETGEFLRAYLGDKIGDKCVVLVGAAIPLHDQDSDAPKNLEFALNNLRVCPPGVWVAIAGRLWDPRKVQKDPNTGEFRERDGV